eukprot:365090-Chlamydomonas_euryale.AAC.3
MRKATAAWAEVRLLWPARATRQTPTIFTKSWGAGSIAPPLTILCLVPAWSCPRLVARSVRPPSGTAGQWLAKLHQRLDIHRLRQCMLRCGNTMRGLVAGAHLRQSSASSTRCDIDLQLDRSERSKASCRMLQFCDQSRRSPHLDVAVEEAAPVPGAVVQRARQSGRGQQGNGEDARDVGHIGGTDEQSGSSLDDGDDDSDARLGPDSFDTQDDFGERSPASLGPFAAAPTGQDNVAAVTAARHTGGLEGVLNARLPPRDKILLQQRRNVGTGSSAPREAHVAAKQLNQVLQSSLASLHHIQSLREVTTSFTQAINALISSQQKRPGSAAL